MHIEPSDRPTRRTLLRAGGLAGLALLAGCTTGASDPGTGDEPTPTPTGTDGGLAGADGDGGAAGGTRPAGSGGPGVSLVGIDGPAAPLAADVTLVAPVATAEAPPALRVTLTNTGDGAVRIGEGRAARFRYVHDESGRLVLLPVESEWDAEPDCWRLRHGIVTTEEYRTFELAPGASATADLALYASSETDACLPVGEHTFRTRYQVGPAGSAPGEGSGGEWGFTVLLE
ncbi:DUF4232 domain-containing protein [Haloglomus salinum]|uniref:DUF4232 domain-containing protein n=1 Tax=Haloglomus salinum TaxID=2962673 RepID=UPI0020C9D172|nr:DUF4232 domain-containing protein [Haloglomus salinum]